MLKTLDDLERAVSRLMERGRGKTPVADFSEGEGIPPEKDVPERPSLSVEGINEEAAELIRRAIKRLRSM